MKKPSDVIRTPKQALRAFDRYARAMASAHSAHTQYLKAPAGGTPRQRHWDRFIGYDQLADEWGLKLRQYLESEATRNAG